MIGGDLSKSLMAICDAAIDQEYWNSALDGIVELTGAKACVLNVVGRTKESPYEISAVSSVYRDFLTRDEGVHYIRELSSHEAANWAAFATQPLREPFPEADVGLTSACLDTRPDCVALERFVGVRRRLCARLTDNPAWFDGMAIGYDPGVKELPESSFQTLRSVLPLGARAIELGRTFSILRERYNAVLGVLDRVGVGMAIALADGQIILHNEECARILAMDDGITLRADGRFRCHRLEEAGQLAHAIATASATAKGENNCAETLMTITRRSGQPRLLVDVAPLRDSSRELDITLKGAVITLIDPAYTRPLRIRNFIELYHLTSTEAQVCNLMMQGYSLDEIAERRGRSPVTVKNQVAAILAKCGVRTRSEMIRLAVRILPPLQ